MARRTTRGAIALKKRKDSSAAWWVALAALVVLVAGAGIWVTTRIASKPRTDAVSLCPVDGPLAVKAILLDLTDPLQPAQASRLAGLIEREIANAPVHTMVSIGVVSEFAANWGSRFARCKPATSADANALYENPTLIAATFEREFMEPLHATLAQTLHGQTENRSPIMESLQALLADTPYALDQGKPLSMVIASDMLQHSETLSLYRAEGWDHLAATGAADRLARNLQGARLKLMIIPRPEASEQARAGIDAFWSRYFDQQGVAAPFDVLSLGDL